MLDYREQIQSIYGFIKRSEEQQKYPYAYEIYLLTGIDDTALTSRTSGTSTFNNDIETAVEKAKQAHGMLRVDVYGGKSANARKLSSYTVNVSGLLNPPIKPMEKAEIATMVQEEVNKRQESSAGGLGELDSLLGLFSGDNPQVKSKLDGLFGVFNALSGNNKEIERIAYQKQLDDFKFETRYNMLHEKYEALREENTALRVEKDLFLNENKDLKRVKVDLEQRLSGYAPNELMKRVAVGVISGIGGRMLSNSPKTAELLGLTPEELKGALGIVEETSDTVPVVDTSVEVTELNAVLSPEDEKKSKIIENLSQALNSLGLSEVAKIANIVGLCIDQPILMDQTLAFLSQTVQGNTDEVQEVEST